MVEPRLRPMTVADIPVVIALERRAMESGWEPGAYRNELTQNGAARYFVCDDVASDPPVLAGFAGLWLQFDQAHIVTVAVDPFYQRQGIGRLLVLLLLRAAAANAMLDATLEVRASNLAARALYRGFGFFEVGLRRRYYLDNGEDAVIMTMEPFANPASQLRLASAIEALEAQFPGLPLAIATLAGGEPA